MTNDIKQLLYKISRRQLIKDQQTIKKSSLPTFGKLLQLRGNIGEKL